MYALIRYEHPLLEGALVDSGTRQGLWSRRRFGAAFVMVKSYYIGRREGEAVRLYSPGNPAIHEEPAQHWWHGIDKKTYNRILR